MSAKKTRGEMPAKSERKPGKVKGKVKALLDIDRVIAADALSQLTQS